MYGIRSWLTGAGAVCVCVAAVSLVWLTGSTDPARAARVVGRDAPCARIGWDMPAAFEPSGMVWDGARRVLWVVSDEGEVAGFTEMGGQLEWYSLAPLDDIEGVTADGSPATVLYIAQEYPPTVHEWSLVRKALTGRSVRVPQFAATAKSGLEGIAYDAQSQTMYAASQLDGNIYAYAFDPAELALTPTHNISTGWERDASGAVIVASRRVGYAVSDAHDEAVGWSLDSGEIVERFPVPVDGQEGLAWCDSCGHPGATLFVANDNGKASSTMSRYAFPLATSSC